MFIPYKKCPGYDDERVKKTCKQSIIAFMSEGGEVAATLYCLEAEVMPSVQLTDTCNDLCLIFF